ncbi:MAG: hypothetical protein ACREXP_12535, partial [Steroidobacteraceae bacterium]
LLTSRIYPLEDFSGTTTGVIVVRAMPTYVLKDASVATVGVLGGTLALNLKTYGNYHAEACETPAFAMLAGGTLTVNLKTYGNYHAEACETPSFTMLTGGTLAVKLITYSNYHAEACESGVSLIAGGTLA